MGWSKSMVWSVAFRMSLLAVNLYALVWTVNRRLFATTLLLGVILFIQVGRFVMEFARWRKQINELILLLKRGTITGLLRDPGAYGVPADLQAALERSFQNLKQELDQKDKELQYYRVLIDQMDVGVMVLTSKGEIDYLNPTARRLLGLGPGGDGTRLWRRHPDLAAAVERMSLGDRRVVRLSSDGVVLTCLVHKTELRFRGQAMRVLTLQNIHREVDSIEIEAWQRLIRVLTHEIMNSLTPIISLTSSLVQRLRDRGKAPACNSKTDEDLVRALSAIHRRSEGLVAFVEKYREVARIPKPNPQPVQLEHLFQRVLQLLKPRIDASSIEVTLSVDPHNLEVRVDPHLFEQVLLNLLMNAIEVQNGMNQARIELRAFLDDRGQCIIQIRDHGPGIPEEYLDQVFVPFFSTRPEGSGIGLTVSRQIVRRHGGTISVQNHPGGGAVFTIRL